MLSRNKMLQARNMRRLLVGIPEWGGEVYVREFTSVEKEEVAIRGMEIVDVATGTIKDARKMAGLKVWIVSRTVVDSDGDRIFEDGDTEALAEKSARVIERLADVATDLSNAVDDVEEAEKNSVSSQSDNSGSN